jgi:hypothetical protein
MIGRRRSDVTADYGGCWEIVLMGRAMKGIRIQRRDYVEASLFEPKGHATRARKKIDGDWSSRRAVA